MPAVSVTIANGETTSTAIKLGQYTIAGVITPAEFDGTAITLTAAADPAGTFYAVHDSDGTAVSLATAASRATGLSGAEADAVAPWPVVKLVCGTAQTGATVLTVLLK